MNNDKDNIEMNNKAEILKNQSSGIEHITGASESETRPDDELPSIDYNEYIDGLPDDVEDEEEELLVDLTSSLGQQVDSELSDYTESDFADDMVKKQDKPVKKSKKGIKIAAMIVGTLLVFALFLIFTSPGRRFALGMVAKFMHSSMEIVDNEPTKTPEDTQQSNNITAAPEPTQGTVDTPVKVHRTEDYVTNYLIFGLEEIDGAANTDAMIIVSLNTKDNKIKLTSLLRDTYVTIPGYNSNKLNSVYAKGASGAATSTEAKQKGAALLMQVIEDTYDLDIAGYACVNFSGFETIIDRLGGIDIELGTEERKYLNKTNYISDPANRTLVDGWNHMNGNQVMGYCRVRKKPTLGGANNDYGRTVRQRRVINAIIKKYSSSSVFDMLPIMSDCLAVVSTNLTAEQITDVLVDVVENGMYSTESMRLPTDELFYDSGKEGVYNGSRNITYALVIDAYVDENIKKFHQFIFLDPEETTGAAATTP